MVLSTQAREHLLTLFFMSQQEERGFIIFGTFCVPRPEDLFDRERKVDCPIDGELHATLPDVCQRDAFVTGRVTVRFSPRA